MDARTAVAVLLIASAVPAPALEMEGNVIRLSDEEVAMCEAEPCLLVSKAKLRLHLAEAVTQAFEEGRRYERATCPNKL